MPRHVRTRKTPPANHVKLARPRPRGAWSKPSARDYGAALFYSPLRWLLPTAGASVLAALLTFLLSLVLGYWSFTLMIIPVGMIFMLSLQADAGHRAWRRKAPPRVPVPVRDLLT